MKEKTNLIWIDLEMSGLDTQTDYILEIATIVTDKNLNILGEGPNLVINQPDEVMNNMDNWNKAPIKICHKIGGRQFNFIK